MVAICFHPFQGRPSFGRLLKRAKEIHQETSFHPFQGRPSFGPTEKNCDLDSMLQLFPSLSGKTFIRTEDKRESSLERLFFVSIPFREDLHSDDIEEQIENMLETDGFHPFQGRPSFGLLSTLRLSPKDQRLFPSLSGKTFIRTVGIKMRKNKPKHNGFHPFQGRPLFGLLPVTVILTAEMDMFPSLSGKTSIRTYLLNRAKRECESAVSIPFREDLHSDYLKVYLRLSL